MKSVSPLACEMGVFTPTERENHLQSTALLYRSVRAIRDVENGFEFVFPNEKDIIKRLGDFIASESSCCPFLEFTLKVAPNDTPISLFLRGPEGVKEFLRAEFSEAFV